MLECSLQNFKSESTIQVKLSIKHCWHRKVVYFEFKINIVAFDITAILKINFVLSFSKLAFHNMYI